MNHIDNIRILKKCGCTYCDSERVGYLKACEQFEKEVEETKRDLCQRPPIEKCGVCINCKTIDRGFTHKEAIKEGEK